MQNKDIKPTPRKQIYEVFDCMREPSIQEHLWEWFKATVSGNFHTLEDREKLYIVLVYELMVKLTEASAGIIKTRP